MGKRGELWVVLQFVIFALILVAPKIEAFSFPLWLRIFGGMLILAGGILGSLGVLSLGRNLSPFPKPIQGGQLVRGGAYRFVRHPIYSGLIFASLGWAVLTDTLLGVGLTIVLFVFFDLKSRREERWLADAYPDYPQYKQRVRKLIPFIY